VGYARVLLDYPRWVIEREVDFTHCPHGGRFDTIDRRCAACHFGEACRWLNVNRPTPAVDGPLQEIIAALDAAIRYLHSSQCDDGSHDRGCSCETCAWLLEAKSFLRLHRHHR
jgi:hypothetical protein